MNTIIMPAFGMPGPWELALIFLIIALVFGAKKIPELANAIGKSISEFKKGLKDDSR